MACAFPAGSMKCISTQSQRELDQKQVAARTAQAMRWGSKRGRCQAKSRLLRSRPDAYSMHPWSSATTTRSQDAICRMRSLLHACTNFAMDSGKVHSLPMVLLEGNCFAGILDRH